MMWPPSIAIPRPPGSPRTHQITRRPGLGRRCAGRSEALELVDGCWRTVARANSRRERGGTPADRRIGHRRVDAIGEDVGRDEIRRHRRRTEAELRDAMTPIVLIEDVRH